MRYHHRWYIRNLFNLLIPRKKNKKTHRRPFLDWCGVSECMFMSGSRLEQKCRSNQNNNKPSVGRHTSWHQMPTSDLYFLLVISFGHFRHSVDQPSNNGQLLAQTAIPRLIYYQRRSFTIVSSRLGIINDSLDLVELIVISGTRRFGTSSLKFHFYSSQRYFEMREKKS